MRLARGSTREGRRRPASSPRRRASGEEERRRRRPRAVADEQRDPADERRRQQDVGAARSRTAATATKPSSSASATRSRPGVASARAARSSSWRRHALDRASARGCVRACLSLGPGFRCGRSRSAARHALGAIRVRQRKSPGTQMRWWHGRQGSGPTSTASANHRGSRHGIERSASVGPNSADDRRPRSSRRRAAARCRPQCTPPRGRPARGARRGRTRRCRARVGASGAELRPRPRRRSRARRRASDGPDVRMMRRARVAPRQLRTISATNDSAGQRRNGLPALTCMTTSGWLGAMPAVAQPRARRAPRRAGSSAISTGSRAGSRRVDAERRRAGPTDSAPSGAASGRRRAATTCVYIQRAARRSCSRCASARRSPSVSQALRGPPCRSIATSKRSRRSRRASARSSRRRRQPAALAARR